MNEKKTVRVIKKDERGRKEPAAPKPNTARDMVQTVTNWVDEFKQRRRTETAVAIKTFLSETPRPNEA